jgi:hypothetical protein
MVDRAGLAVALMLVSSPCFAAYLNTQTGFGSSAEVGLDFDFTQDAEPPTIGVASTGASLSASSIPMTTRPIP